MKSVHYCMPILCFVYSLADFENVNHIHAANLTRNGRDADLEADSDEDFEIIS